MTHDDAHTAAPSTGQTVQIPPSGHYPLDPERSTITFRAKHMFGLGRVHGSFGLRGGEISVAEPATESSAHAEIAADRFTTGNSVRDGVVCSPKYLDVANHPTMRFSSQHLAEAEGTWVLTGALTVREVTKPVHLTVDRCAMDAGDLSVRATTRIDRTEFNITAQPGMTGRYLDIVVDLTATPAPVADERG